MKGIKLITAATAEPISLVIAKQHLKVETTDDDDLVTALIKAARETAESFTGRALASQTFEYILDEFPQSGDMIFIPNPPLESVESIKYKDYEGTEVEWDSSNYIIDSDNIPARISLAYNKIFPVFTPYPVSAVRIRFVAGYKIGGDPHLIIPEQINNAIKFLIGHFYENRESVVIGTITSKVPFAVEAMLYPYKITWG